MFKNKRKIANVISIFLTIAIAAIIVLRFEKRIEEILRLLFPLIVVFALCIYYWQGKELDKIKPNLFMISFGLLWTFFGFFIGTLIYRASFVRIITFDQEELNKLGYLGILAVGPFVFLLGVVSSIRWLILKILKA